MVLSFPPDVFARLEPEIYLQRHIENGIRPSGARRFEDFRPIKAQLGNIKNTIGSALVRAVGAGHSTLLLKTICH
jgi:exosome complex component RRP43